MFELGRREFITLLGGAAAALADCGKGAAGRKAADNRLPRRRCYGVQSMDGCFCRAPARTGLDREP